MNNHIIKNILINTLSQQPISALASLLLGQGTPIFMLHRTYPNNTPGKVQTPDYLKRCLNYLRSHGYQFVSVTQILESITHNRQLPKKSIAFTIDDGFWDQGELAAPVFIEFNCPVTIFLITDFISGTMWPWFSKAQYMLDQTNTSKLTMKFDDQEKQFNLTSENARDNARKTITEEIKKLEWAKVAETLNNMSVQLDVPLPDSPPDYLRPMDWAMVKQLENEGISFGPHTMTHPILAKVDEKTAHDEITGSWEYLKNTLKNPAPVFCYPNGELADFSEREINIVRQTDMLGALSTIPMQLQKNIINPEILFKVPRYSLPDNFNDFVMYSSWLELAKEKIRRQKI